MTRGPHKLSFSVSRVSSEDADFPARDLTIQHPECHGWQTERFGSFPQEIELRLSCQCSLAQLQILTHEYKIPTKCDIYVLSTPSGCDDPSQVVERRLGHLKFSDNERAGHQIRELKTVNLDHLSALFIRLVFSKCYVNKHNIYNQVGVVAINLVGASHSGSLAHSCSTARTARLRTCPQIVRAQ
jgi:centrosomal protein CEP104